MYSGVFAGFLAYSDTPACLLSKAGWGHDMNIARVKAIADDPKRTRKELEQMLVNAKAQRNDEAERAIQEVLHSRFPSLPAALNRDSPDVAAEILESLFPRKLDRTAILSRLLKSSAIAEAAAPNAWAVTVPRLLSSKRRAGGSLCGVRGRILPELLCVNHQGALQRCRVQ